MKVLVQYLAVAGAGALGAVARLAIGQVCFRLFATSFPIGTMIINITGSLFLGWFAIAGPRWMLSDTTRIAIAVGFVGAYTTFSTFMFDSDRLLRDGAVLQSGMNIILSLVLGLAAVRLGIWLAGG